MNTDAPKKIQGVVAYLVTPFSDDGSVDVARLRELTEQLIADGVHAIAPLGSAGVHNYLTVEERELVVQTVCEHTAARLPIIVGASGASLDEAVRTARFSEKWGADAVLAAPTSDWRLTTDEVFNFYSKLSEKTSLPIMIYDSLMKAGGLMSVDELLKLSTIPSVTMLKDSSGDVERLQELLIRSEGKLEVFAGKNTFAVPALLLGCAGWCTAAPLVAPKESLALYAAAVEKKDLTQALRIGRALQPLLQCLVKYGLPRSVLAALDLQGKSAGAPRAPMLSLDEGARAVIQQAIANLTSST